MKSVCAIALTALIISGCRALPRTIQQQSFSSLRTSAAIDPPASIPPIPLRDIPPQSSSLWPCNDELDKRIISLTLPAILNQLIVPLVGAVDTFFVGQMGNTLALAGQGAANQIFASTFWIFSFFPNVITPLVAQSYAAKDDEGLRRRVGEAILLGSITGLLGCLLLIGMPQKALNLVLAPNSPARSYAATYLKVRGLTFLPAIVSSICFAAFRGTLNVMVPLRIALISNLVNAFLDPLYIFTFRKGVVGAAIATCISEMVSLALYFREMAFHRMVGIRDIFNLPRWSSLKPLLGGAAASQLRAVSFNVAFLAVTRRTQALDATGTAAAAHAITMQLWQLGGVFLLALGGVAGILVPSKRAEAGVDKVTALKNAKLTADRLLRWGFLLGIALSAVQLSALPLLKIFSPLAEVQAAARIPSIIGALLQIINGTVFAGEGIQSGNQGFGMLAVATGAASLGMLISLHFFGSSLVGVWASYTIFNLVRLAGVLHHHFIDGPLAPSKIALAEQAALKEI